MKLCVNTLLGLGVQALAEAIALGVKAGLPRERFLQVLGETAVVSPSQKSKLENARKDDYPAAAAAVQVAAAEHARQSAAHSDEDFSVVIRAMERLAGVA